MQKASVGKSRFDLGNTFCQFWLRAFFFLSRHAPGMVRFVKPIAVWITITFVTRVKAACHANCRRIIGPDTTTRRCQQFSRNVVSTFYDFVSEIGRCEQLTPDQIASQIVSIEGKDRYLSQRKKHPGAIIITAHLGSFEVGLVGLKQVEPDIHVVFKRDAADGFETLRRNLRQKLGIHEAPIDDGWNTWLKLRDALAQNHVVVMQADRAMPGQKSQAVPILHGHLQLPMGPIQLAQMTGVPVFPMFTVRNSNGKIVVHCLPAIHIDLDAAPIDNIHPALFELGKCIEQFLFAFGDQWLVLHKAFMEDNPSREN